MFNDFCQIDELFSEDELMIQNIVRDFTNKEIIPIIGDCFEKCIFPKDLVKKIADLGILGIVTPEQYGGAGMSYTHYGLAMQELERGDSSIRSFCSVQNSLVMFPILEYGTEDQKNKWLPKLATGECIGCFGLTEADAGSNPAEMLTNAVEIQTVVLQILLLFGQN